MIPSASTNIGILAMTDKVMIDTNIWIECFKDKASAHNPLVVRLIKEDKAALCGIILTELMIGAKSAQEADLIRDYAEGLNLIEITTEQYIHSGLLGSLLRKKGIIVPLPDLIIAQLCISEKITIYTQDKHFKLIADQTELKILEA